MCLAALGAFLTRLGAPRWLSHDLKVIGSRLETASTVLKRFGSVAGVSCWHRKCCIGFRQGFVSHRLCSMGRTMCLVGDSTLLFDQQRVL